MDERNQEILQKVLDYLDKEGEGGQVRLSNEIGYSNSSAINQYIKGTYKSPKAIESKLAEFFTVKTQSDKLTAMPDYLPTSISQAVYLNIKSCHEQGGLCIECGDPGIGKTKAAQKYVCDYPNTAILITVNPCFSSISSFLKLLCKALHCDQGRKDDMWLRCADRLSGHKVLIVDESQHLTIKTIELIRAFADYVQNLGIVFIGNRNTVDNMSGQKEAVYAQITSRMKLKKIRFTSNIQASDIELLFPQIAKKEQEIKFMLAVAQSKQGIRGATNLFTNAMDNENITIDGLVAMAKFMELVI